MNKFCLIFVSLCGLFSSNLFSQSSIADSLFDIKEYDKAIVSYERSVFSSTNEDSVSGFLIKKSFAYKASQQYEKAITTLERINVQLLSDSLNFIVYYELAINAFLDGRFNEAIGFCNIISYYHKDKDYPMENVYIVLALSNNEIGNYEDAFKYSISSLNNSTIDAEKRDSLKHSINILFSHKNLPLFKKPEKAELLSAIIPGLGQCYSGYYLEGFASFLTHVGLAAITGYAVYKAYYLTAYFGGVSMFMKFYFGGSRRSEFLAHKRNEKIKLDFYNKNKQLILPK